MTGTGSPPVALVLDTAGLLCLVAVALGDRVLSAERIENMHGQAEVLLPMVDGAMRKAGLTPAALDLVAVTGGPGSFTGIRVGLAAARGIALATGARLIGVTSFEAVAATFRRDCDRDRFLLVALESRREDLYVQFFDPRLDPISAPAAIMPLALGGAVNATIGAAPLTVAGDAAQRAALALAERLDTRILTDDSADAEIGALRAALRALRLGKEHDAARPLYLRPPDVTLPSGRRERDHNRA